MSNDLRQQIETSLAEFGKTNLASVATGLLNTLGYRSDKTLDLDGSPDAFVEQFDNSPDQPFNKDKALFDDWKSVEFLFQLTDEELGGQASLFETNDVNTGLLQSYLFFAVELTGDNYARGKLTNLMRQINRLFPTPVMVLIKHLSDKQPALSIAVMNRRQNKRDAALDRARRDLPARVYSKDLIELIFRQPYTKGQFLVDAGIAERKTAADYLKALESIGLLSARKVGRENLYLNTELYDLLSR